MKKFVLVIMMLIILSALFIGCSGEQKPGSTEEVAEQKPGSTEEVAEQKPGSTEEDSVEVIELKFADVSSPTSAVHHAMQAIAAEVKEKTEGRIVIEVYPGGQLGSIMSTIEAIQMDTLDMAISNSASLASVEPAFGVLSAPFIIKDDAHANGIAFGEVGFGEVAKTLNELAAKKNINVVAYNLIGFRHVFSISPIMEVDDFKGVKLRTMQNKIDMELFNALGAMSTPTAYAEVFTALQQKTIDAAENSIDNYYTERFFEVAKNVTLTGHFYGFNPVIMSNSAIEKIPEDLRDTFFEACISGIKKGNEICREANETAKTELESQGITFFDIDRTKLAQITEPIYAKNIDLLDPDIVELIRNA